MALPGKNALVKVDSEIVAEINDVTFSINGEIVDTSSFDQDGFRRRIRNLTDANVSIAGFYDPDDTDGQVDMRTKAIDGSKVEGVEVLPDGVNGLKCDCYVETWEITAGVEGAIGISISLQSDGEVETV